MRKFYILSLIFVFGFAFCLTNGFADKVDGFVDEAGGFADDNFIPVENFEFPTADGPAYIQGTPEFQRGPENIIGTNDFEKMRDLPSNSPDYQLGRKVGMIIIPSRFDPNRAWACTGFLVGPDLFMTNHHCIHDDFGPRLFEDARIYMDYYQDQDVNPTRGGVTAGVSEILRAEELKDYALLRLDRPIGDIYGWLELDTTTRVDSSQSVKLISHPDARSKEIVRRNTEIVELPTALTDDYPFLLAYLADVEPGSSGSPVFLRDGTGVIAINHSSWTSRSTGEPVFNAGSLMSYIVPEIQQYLPSSTTVDLVVEAPQVSKDWLRPGESFTLSATVRNQGRITSSGTTLRFYQSLDSIVTTSDVEVGTAFVSSLGHFETGEASITLTAPTSPGTYYYSACVDVVVNEIVTDNNCSTGINVTASTTPPVYMYWTDWRRDKIQRATLNGTHVTDLIGGLLHPLSITVDIAGGHIYWTEFSTGVIQRLDLDGSNLQTLVTGLSTPLGSALDVAGGHIYWTDNGTRSIQRANLDGSNLQTLVTGLSGPTGLVLDVASGKMYWADWDANTDRIQRANLDGSNVETLIPTGSGLLTPTGLALDVVGRKMYWTDSNARSIQRANLDGTDIETLISVNVPVHIALDITAGKMYWSAQQPGRIQRANLNGSNVETLVTRGLERPFGIALGIAPVIPSPPSPPSEPIAFNPPTVEDQTFTVNSPVNLTLPTATGGTTPYTYTLSPIPPGLEFVVAFHSLAGTPTTVGVTDVTYTVTDATDASAALDFTIEVIPAEVPADDHLDINGDGQVDVLDLVLVAVFYGTRGDGLPADVNADGIVNVQDFAAVAAGVDAADDLSAQVIEDVLLAAIEQAADLENAAGAPMGFGNRHLDTLSVSIAYGNVADALVDTRHSAVTDARLERGVTFLETLLQLLTEMDTIPETTALLPNYPNPFNPETWLPYQLATPTEVTLSIYSIDGQLVRTLDLGHQPTGVYQSKHRAAYWDGKNQLGEPVASGVYFYTLTADDFTATRKMLIAK